jgi:hypothetical protein
MAISTFAELKTAIDNWLARTDMADRAAEFIALAEARMNRELETRSQETRVTATLTAGDAYVSLPTDVRAIRHVRLNTSPRTILKYMTPEQADREFPSTGNGKPKAYSVVGTEIYFRPTPDDTHTAEITYVANVTPLSDSNTTNNILTRHPDLYLHGALAEAFGYLMDDQKQAQHDALFQRAAAAIQADEDRARFAGPLTLTSDYGEVA